MHRVRAFWWRALTALRRQLVERWLWRRQLEKLYLVLGGHIFFQTLSAAVELDLFSLLARQRRMTRSEIAECLGLEEKPARILLLGCTALGLLKKRGASYSNSRLAERYLARGMRGNIIPIVEWQHHINYRAMHAFAASLKANRNVGLEEFEGHERTLYERLARRPELEAIFQSAMEMISAQANTILATHVDLSHVRCLVDVGGGNGTNIIALARRYPGLRAMVFDSPSVCRIARENIRAAALEERLGAVEGDCFRDPFPPGVDCLLFAHFFTIWSEEKNRMLLKKSFDALGPGGSVIIFNMMQSDDETGPLSAAMGSPYFLTIATGEGMLYTRREYETWMKEAGFAEVKTYTLPMDHGAVIGVKA